jgi:hypothetical protein
LFYTYRVKGAASNAQFYSMVSIMVCKELGGLIFYSNQFSLYIFLCACRAGIKGILVNALNNPGHKRRAF